MIAILIHYIERSSGGYEQVLRRAFIDACKEHDLDFTLICGSELDAPSPELRVHNRMYDLVHPDYFDGAILIPAGISACSGTAGMLARFAGIASFGARSRSGQEPRACPAFRPRRATPAQR